MLTFHSWAISVHLSLLAFILSSEDSLDTTKEDMNEGHKDRLRKNEMTVLTA